MSKSKEKLKKFDEKIEEEKQKELARIQLEAAREIAMKGFSRFGIRDFFENTVVQALLLSFGVFFGLFFGFGTFFYLTRNFQWYVELPLLFIGTSIPGFPNIIWWILIGSIIAAEILVPRFYEKWKVGEEPEEKIDQTTIKQIRFTILGVSFIIFGILFVVLALTVL